MKLQQRIKQLTEKHLAYGLSQNKLTVAAHVNRPYLSRIETGTVLLSEELLVQLEETIERYMIRIYLWKWSGSVFRRPIHRRLLNSY